MHIALLRLLAITVVLATLVACASRPINLPLVQAERKYGYRIENRPQFDNDDETLMILAFSGGGTRAAAFSFGVLEELKRTEVTVGGERRRLVDEVDVITGVSGGSFTALAFALHSDKLFAEYERRFLKRNVQGELILRALSPWNWSALGSEGYGRSELAADFYDEILFDHATFGDLEKRPGPYIIVTATDISTGSRLSFGQDAFDLICSDLSGLPLSRAAAASSAVPLVLSPVTLNNYGGRCGYKEPQWVKALLDPARTVRPAGRAIQRLKEMRAFEDSAGRPYLHLVDGGVSDNLGLRAILEAFEQVEASRSYRRFAQVDNLKRIVILIVNSLSVPRVDWDKRERPPNDIQILLKATGVPIDRYSYEGIELLKDIIARWQLVRSLRASGAFANAGNPMFARAADIPDVDLFAIDVSFEAHPDAAERTFLNQTPTSFALTDEQVDRLRQAAGVILRTSPEYQRLLKEIGGTTADEAVSTSGQPAAQ